MERLRAAAPEHPLPDCLDAAAAAKSGDLAAAKAALARALERKGPRDSRQAERMAMLTPGGPGVGVPSATGLWGSAGSLRRGERSLRSPDGSLRRTGHMLVLNELRRFSRGRRRADD